MILFLLSAQVGADTFDSQDMGGTKETVGSLDRTYTELLWYLPTNIDMNWS